MWTSVITDITSFKTDSTDDKPAKECVVGMEGERMRKREKDSDKNL